MSDRVLVDLRNVYKREEVLRHNFRYVNVGEGATVDHALFAEASE